MKTNLPIFLAAMLVTAGCMSVQKSTVFKDVTVESGRTPLAAVEIENSVWTVFGLPIGSGNPDRPNGNSCRFFRDTVKLANNLKVLEREREASGADSVANLTSHFAEETYLFILLARRSCHTSAILLKPEETKRQ